MLIYKKAVSVILLILGLSFSGLSYANAENSFDDESNVIMEALNSTVDGFRKYPFSNNFAFVPLELVAAAGLYGINAVVYDKDKAFEKSMRTSKAIIANQVIRDSKILTLSEPISAIIENGKVQTAQQVIKTQKLSQAQLYEYVKRAKGPLTFRAINIFSGALVLHAGLVVFDTGYLAFTN